MAKRQPLEGKLVVVVGGSGFLGNHVAQALLSRALHLARAEFALLDGISAGRPPGTCLMGLSERMHDFESGQPEKALRAVLSIVVDLMIGFIGEDLTWRLMRDVWPDLPSRELGPGSGHEAAS